MKAKKNSEKTIRSAICDAQRLAFIRRRGSGQSVSDVMSADKPFWTLTMLLGWPIFDCMPLIPKLGDRPEGQLPLQIVLLGSLTKSLSNTLRFP